MTTDEDLKVAIAALRALHKFPKGAKRLYALNALIELWRTGAGGGFSTALLVKFEADFGDHLVASIKAHAALVNIDDEAALRLDELLDVWAVAGVPGDPFIDRISFVNDLLVATNPAKQGDQSTAPRLHARMERLNALRRQSFAEAGLQLQKATPAPKEAAASAAELLIAQVSKRSKEHFTLLPVWFGTDRAFDASDPRRVRVESSRGADQVTYGVAELSIPKSHKEGEIERPAARWNFFGDDTEYPHAHIVIHTVQVLEKATWVDNMIQEDGEDGLLFIHGFNVSFEEALWRTAQMAHDLKFPGHAFCFSWASLAKVRGYGADEATIGWSTPHLRQFLQTLCSDLKLKNLHIVAHSMGNRALLDVLEAWQQQDKGTHIRQIVLAAPDIDAGRFRQIGQAFNRFDQVTLYASKEDKAIKLSRSLHVEPRAGDANPPLVMADLSTIDVTKAGEGMFDLAHSYYAEVRAVFHDLFYVINQGLKPVQRAGLRFVESNGHYELK